MFYIDGRIAEENAEMIHAVGAEILVVGSMVFGSDKPQEAMKHISGTLRSAINGACT